MKFNKRKYFLHFFLLPLFLLSGTNNLAQSLEIEIKEKIPFLQPADTLHKERFWTCSAIGATIYGSAIIGLNKIWYAETERSSFQLFNDLGEWNHVDKMGHTFTAYNYTNWLFTGAKWTGMKRRRAMWTGAGLSFLLQGTIEVMDGYSAKWGFSIPDVAFNTLGIGLFVGQELAWKEQRIIMKVSSTVPSYSTDILTSVDGIHTTTYRERAHSLYGSRFPETLLKDYNAQTNWFSFNIHSFIKRKDTRFPQWLNIAIGYGAQNMFEGFNYNWTEEKTGIQYQRNPNIYPRYSQLYFSFDIDLMKIKTKSRFLKTVFSILNWIKIPSPTLEFTTLGNVRFLPIYF